MRINIKKYEKYQTFVIGAKHCGKTHFQNEVFLKSAPKRANKIFKAYINGEIEKEGFVDYIATLLNSVINIKEGVVC